MSRILIIADDLTGALDSAVAFASRGLRVIAVRDISGFEPALTQGVDVLALATGTRERSRADAVARVEAFARPVVGWADIVFKKVDSRLKGHVAAEVNTVARLFGLESALIAPAIPDFGRYSRNGVLEGSGIAEPINILSRFADLDLPIQVPDVASPGDFDTILASGSNGRLLVGARGLASALAERLAGPAQALAQTLPEPLVFTIGSRDPITLAQVAMLRECEDIEVAEAPNGLVTSTTGGARAALVQMTPGIAPVDSDTATRRFAAGLAAWCEGALPSTIIASGGETGDSLLDQLGVGLLNVEGELLPGIPLSRFDYNGHSVALVTKSGGFGSPDTLLQLKALMR